MKTILILFLAAVSLVAKAEAPFSSNDLAIMFPLDQSTRLPLQQVTLVTPKWNLLSSKNFKAVLAAAAKNGVFLNAQLSKPESWYLVGLRYSPCTIMAGKAKPCMEQIRFVLQPFNAIRMMGFDDYAMHVVFNYNETNAPENSSRLESFRLLKNQFGAASLNKTLKPNALLSSDQGEKYFSAIQDEIIEKHINHRNASLVTFMGLAKFGSKNEEDPHDWRFFAGPVNSNGEWSISNLPTGHTVQVERFKIFDEGEDEAEGPFSIKPILGQAHLITGNSSQLDLAALKILNMKQTNDHNVDCASCHIADRQIFPVMLDLSEKGKNIFIDRLQALFNGNSRMTEVVINNDIHVGRKGSEFPIPRMFGYLDNSPLISQRLVIDNALSIEAANKILGLKVTPQCQGSGQRKAFLECLYFNGPGENVSSCLRKNCF